MGETSNRCFWFFCGEVASNEGCCTPMNAWIPADIGSLFPINVYGEDPVNITVEAIWLNHYPVDLKIQVLDNYSTSEMVRMSGIYIFL